MEKIKFRVAEKTGDICDCWKITDKVVEPISKEECCAFINSRGVKCFGSDYEGYIVYGK